MGYNLTLLGGADGVLWKIFSSNSDWRSIFKSQTCGGKENYIKQEKTKTQERRERLKRNICRSGGMKWRGKDNIRHYKLETCVNRVYRNQIGANPKGNIQRECV